MADKNTQYYLDALEQGIRRNASPNMSELSKHLQFAEFDITLETGFLAANDNYVLGRLGRAAIIIPNLSFAVGVSGAVGASIVLEKVTASGAAPAALAPAAAISTDGTAVAFGVASGSTTGFPTVSATDYLQASFTVVGAVANGDVVKLIVAYIANGSVSV